MINKKLENSKWVKIILIVFKNNFILKPDFRLKVSKAQSILKRLPIKKLPKSFFPRGVSVALPRLFGDSAGETLTGVKILNTQYSIPNT